MASEQRIQKLKELLEKDPNDSFSRYALALEYMGMRDTQTAIDELEKLIAADQKYLAAFHQLGQIYGKLNRTAEAKKNIPKGNRPCAGTGRRERGKRDARGIGRT